MASNIKNRETERLIKELSQLTGESLTQAITIAVQERLRQQQERRRKVSRIDRLRELAHRCALEARGASSSDHNRLYDENGLPA